MLATSSPSLILRLLPVLLLLPLRIFASAVPTSRSAGNVVVPGTGTVGGKSLHCGMHFALKQLYPVTGLVGDSITSPSSQSAQSGQPLFRRASVTHKGRLNAYRIKFNQGPPASPPDTDRVGPTHSGQIGKRFWSTT